MQGGTKRLECTMTNLSVIEKMMPLTMTVGVDTYLVQPLDLMATCSQSPSTNGTVNCSLMVVYSDVGAVLGIPFFNSNLVVFDKNKSRVGMYVLI